MKNEETVIIRKLGKPGCRPCFELSNILSSIEEEIGKAGAVVVEQDIKEEPELIDRYEISGVPVLIFERDGVEYERLSGLASAEQLLGAIEKAKLAKASA